MIAPNSGRFTASPPDPTAFPSQRKMKKKKKFSKSLNHKKDQPSTINYSSAEPQLRHGRRRNGH